MDKTVREREQSESTPFFAEDWRLGVERALSREGYRFTMPRRAILDWIDGRERAFTPEALTEALEGGEEPSSRATVYRLLNWLHGAGWLVRVHRPVAGGVGELGGGPQHAYARALPGHYSAVCAGCGIVLTVRAGDLGGVIAPALSASGFAMRGYSLEIHGFCAACSRDKTC